MPEASDDMKTPRTELAGNRAAGHSPALGPVTPEQQREATAGSYSLNVSPAPATDAHDPEHAAAGPEPQVGSSSLQTPGPRRSLLGQVLQPVRQLLRWLLHGQAEPHPSSASEPLPTNYREASYHSARGSSCFDVWPPTGAHRGQDPSSPTSTAPEPASTLQGALRTVPGNTTGTGQASQLQEPGQSLGPGCQTQAEHQGLGCLGSPLGQHQPQHQHLWVWGVASDEEEGGGGREGASPRSPAAARRPAPYPHPHQSFNERAKEAWRDARHVVTDTREALPEAAGRIMGKGNYGHTCPAPGSEAWQWQRPAPPSPPTPTPTHVEGDASSGEEGERSRQHGMAAKGKEILDALRQAGRTLRHPGSSASEAAGRIMGREGYQHPYEPLPHHQHPAPVASRGQHLQRPQALQGSGSHPVLAPLHQVVEQRPSSTPPSRPLG